MATIFDTKMHPPLLRREAALALMVQTLAQPMTVIRAPAGSGKSTLVAQWGAGLAHSGSDHRDLAGPGFPSIRWRIVADPLPGI